MINTITFEVEITIHIFGLILMLNKNVLEISKYIIITVDKTCLTHDGDLPS